MLKSLRRFLARALFSCILSDEFISRGRRRFFYIEVMNESYLTQSQADALIFGFLAADEENKREHDDRYVVAR